MRQRGREKEAETATEDETDRGGGERENGSREGYVVHASL